MTFYNSKNVNLFNNLNYSNDTFSSIEKALNNCTLCTYKVRLDVKATQFTLKIGRALTSREFHIRVVGGHYSIRNGNRVFFFISKKAKTSQNQVKTSCLLTKQTNHNFFL